MSSAFFPGRPHHSVSIRNIPSDEGYPPSYTLGSRTRPRKRIVPVGLSSRRKRNGRSTRNSMGGGGSTREAGLHPLSPGLEYVALTSAFLASLAAFLVTLLCGLGALYLRRHKSAV